MGVSHTIIEVPGTVMEFSVDVDVDEDGIDPTTFALSMGTGFTGFPHASVNIEIPNLSLDQFADIVKRMNEVLELHQRKNDDSPTA